MFDDVAITIHQSLPTAVDTKHEHKSSSTPLPSGDATSRRNRSGIWSIRSSSGSNVSVTEEDPATPAPEPEPSPPEPEAPPPPPLCDAAQEGH